MVEHVVTRTVRDSAAMLDVTGRARAGLALRRRRPRRGPTSRRSSARPGRLRIAWSSRDRQRPADRTPRCRRRSRRPPTLLERLGHEVVQQGLRRRPARALRRARAPAPGANFAAGMRRLIEQIGREPEPDELEPLTWASLKGGRRATGEEAMADMQELRMLGRQALAAVRDLRRLPDADDGHAAAADRLPRPGAERAARLRPPQRRVLPVPRRRST